MFCLVVVFNAFVVLSAISMRGLRKNVRVMVICCFLLLFSFILCFLIIVFCFLGICLIVLFKCVCVVVMVISSLFVVGLS